MLGLESILTQKDEGSTDFTDSQAFELCSGKFATQGERLNVSGTSEAEFLVNSQIVDDSQVSRSRYPFLDTFFSSKRIFYFLQNINLTLEDTKDGHGYSEANISVERYCSIQYQIELK